MNNRFIVITTVYNVNDWLPINLQIMRYQSYKNWKCIIIDDHSTDNSLKTISSNIENDDRFIVTKTKKPQSGPGGGFLHGIDLKHKDLNLNDEDIIVCVDGDDWLSSVFVLEYLNNIYNDKKVWMTYGQYQMYPKGNLGGHYDMNIDPEIDRKNDYRKYPFPFSHLKTFKYWLFNKIDRKDFIDSTTNDIWATAWDIALCLPMVEMAGLEHIHRCEDILYVLNRSKELKHMSKMRTAEQKQAEINIRKRKIYNRL